jgi:hypothetical protein
MTDAIDTVPAGRADLAWLLATCPEPKVRNGRKAVDLAKTLTEYDLHPYNLTVLAAAHAENGDFAKAVEIQNKAIELAEVAAEDQLNNLKRGSSVTSPDGSERWLIKSEVLVAMRARIGLYTGGSPFRDE